MQPTFLNNLESYLKYLFIALFAGATPSLVQAQSPFAGAYDGAYLIETLVGSEVITTSNEPDVDVTVSETGIISITVQNNVITGAVDDEGTITFDGNPTGFTTGQITEGTINAIGSTTLNTVETRTTLTATFLGTLPNINLQPVAQTAGPGETVTFTVEGENTESYQWVKDGVDIEGQTGTSIEIENVSIDNVGTYQVRLINSAGEVISDPVELNLVIPGDNPLYDGRRFHKIADGRTVLESGNHVLRFHQGAQGSGIYSARTEERKVYINFREDQENITSVNNSIYKWSRIGLERIADLTTDNVRHKVTRLAHGPNAHQNDEIVFTSTDVFGTGIFRGSRYNIDSLLLPGLEGDTILGKRIGLNFQSGTSVLENGALLFSGKRLDDEVENAYIPSNLYYYIYNEEEEAYEYHMAWEGGFSPDGSDKTFYPIELGKFSNAESNQRGESGDGRLLATRVISSDRQVSGILAIENNDSPVLLVDSEMTLDGIELAFFDWLQIFGDWIYFDSGDVLGNYLIGRVNMEGTIEVLVKTGDPVPDRTGRSLGAFVTITESLFNATGNFAVNESGLFFCSNLTLEDSNPGGAGLYLKAEGQPFQTITDERDVYDGRQAVQFQVWPYSVRRNECDRDDLVIQVGFGPFPGGGNGLYTNMIVHFPEVSSILFNETNQVVLVFNSNLGLTHTVEASTNMEDWTVVETGIQGVEGDLTWTSPDPFDPTRIYYRITSN